MRTHHVAGHRHRGARIAAVGAVVALVAATGCTRFGASLSRAEDPVITTGAALPKLIGSAPSAVVGFAWDGSAWHQVPVQVDERDQVNPGQILHRPAASWAKLPGGAPFTILAYTPPPSPSAGYTSYPTYTPPDSDPTFDANDELSFLGNDTGKAADAAAGDPTQVDVSTRQQVHVTDPVTSADGYLYLYKSTTLTGGGAGTTGVVYTFSLDRGPYLTTYRMGTASIAPNNTAGTNPEHSTVTTPLYSQTYGDRWLNNGVAISAGGASGTNFYERARTQFLPGYCGRSEDTFDDVIPSSPYEAGYIVNISGPVRAIRSHVGTNSGTYTTTTDIFYPGREDSITDLRVHTIPAVMSFDDLLTSATGLTYTDDQNTGVPIDGTPDTITAAHASPWAMVSGPTGSLVTQRGLVTDIPGVELSTYYLDQSPASPAPCTGDAAAWGQNGVKLTGPGAGNLACTDPTIYGGGTCPTVSGQTTAYKLQATRTRYFEAPNLTAAQAAALANRAGHPLAVAAT